MARKDKVKILVPVAKENEAPAGVTKPMRRGTRVSVDAPDAAAIATLAKAFASKAEVRGKKRSSAPPRKETAPSNIPKIPGGVKKRGVARDAPTITKEVAVGKHKATKRGKKCAASSKKTSSEEPGPLAEANSSVCSAAPSRKKAAKEPTPKIESEKRRSERLAASSRKKSTLPAPPKQKSTAKRTEVQQDNIRAPRKILNAVQVATRKSARIMEKMLKSTPPRLPENQQPATSSHISSRLRSSCGLVKPTTQSEELLKTGNEDCVRTIKKKSARGQSYTHIEKNQYSKAKIFKKLKTDCDHCKCAANGRDCTDGCENRGLLTECPKECKANCKNQRFRREENADVKVVFINNQVGYGLKATRPIKRGRFIIEYKGEVMTEKQSVRRQAMYAKNNMKHHYIYSFEGITIDATLMGNESRFINHSCSPNAVCEPWIVPDTPGEAHRVGFFAIKPIKTGEEITFDYKFNNGEQCHCGSDNCRKVM